MIEKLLNMLSIKRFEQLQKFSPTTDERRVNSLKKRVQHAYDNNIITLVQKRHGDLDYEYIAVRI